MKITENIIIEGKILIITGIIIFITVVLATIVRNYFLRLIRKMQDQSEKDVTNIKFVKDAMVTLIYIVGFGLCIHNIPTLSHVATTLMTGAGILAATIGFASQQTLSNFVSGVFLILYKPLKINDQITIRDSISGKVEDIGLRHIVLRNFENKRIIIPNSVVGSEIIINQNHTEDVICKWVEISVAYTADIKKARKIMQEEAISHPSFIDYRTPKDRQEDKEIVPVRVVGMGDFSITMRAWTWAKDPSKAFLMGCDLLESIKGKFESEGIEIPYPYRNVINKNASSYADDRPIGN